MKKITYTLIIFLFAITAHQAQDTGGFVFGIKGGPSVGFQKWDNFERDPLFATHVVGFIESLPVEGKFAVFVQAGYHVRGSAIRNRLSYNTSTGDPRPPTRKFKFKNLALAFGGKQLKPLGANSSWYYMFGIRGEYTIGTNLSEYEAANTFFGLPVYPADDENDWVRNMNYGMILGGGIDFNLSEHIGMILELSVSPDFSNQYRQDPFPNAVDLQGNSRPIEERIIRNNTIELSIGFRFNRVVEYID